MEELSANAQLTVFLWFPFTHLTFASPYARLPPPRVSPRRLCPQRLLIESGLIRMMCHSDKNMAVPPCKTQSTFDINYWPGRGAAGWGLQGEKTLHWPQAWNFLPCDAMSFPGKRRSEALWVRRTLSSIIPEEFPLRVFTSLNCIHALQQHGIGCELWSRVVESSE